MKIIFDPSFDGSAWPGPLAERTAVVDEVWAGTTTLLGLLETSLGLSQPAIAASKRTASLLPTLAATPGFWSKSFTKDPLATAETLLRWRDWLRLHGWQGQPVSERLAQLAQVTAYALPGEPDRLQAVLMALQTRRTAISRIERILPVTDLPLLWQNLFAALAKQGVAIEDRDLPPAAAHGNLAAARKPDFAPSENDPTLQLLQTNGALEAADRTAAYLASLDNLQGIAVVGGDSVLDAALRRYGLPTAGLPLSSGGNALLSVLPLVLACAWQPPNPQHVLELLALPKNPIDRRLRRKLIEALQAQPAVNSDAWCQALEKGLAAIKDADQQQNARQRISELFGATTCRDNHYPVAEARQRAGLVMRWLMGNQNAEDLPPTDRPLWGAAVAQCEILLDLLDCSGLQTLDAELLRRLVAMATDGTATTTPLAAQAGLAHVRQPGGVAGPAKQVVWWGFAGGGTATAPAVPLTLAEQAALCACGVALPDATQTAQVQAARWRRPFLQASEALLLVSPLRDPQGEAQFLHPLWAEIQGRLAQGGCIEALLHQKGFLCATSPDVQRELRPLPTAQRHWQVAPGRVPTRSKESPSGAGGLIGCPLQWVLNYACGVRPATAAALPQGDQLKGTLVHSLINKLAHEAKGDASLYAPAAATKRMAELFDTVGPQLAAPLFQPGAESDRARVRSVAIAAAGAIWSMLHKTSSRVVESEDEHATPWQGSTLAGRLDLVVDNPLRIIDMKWGGRSSKFKSLKQGSAYQLAAYSQLLQQQDQLPPTAYFILTSQRFLTVDGKAFDVASVDGPDMPTVWQAFDKAYANRLLEVQAGKITAEAVVLNDSDDAPSKDEIDEAGQLRLVPGCRYCNCRNLCGAERPKKGYRS